MYQTSFVIIVVMRAPVLIGGWKKKKKRKVAVFHGCFKRREVDVFVYE